MTITDIDKQVETWFKNQLGTAGDEQKLKNLVNQIYSQAKAEQREEIDKHKEQIKRRMEIEAARGKEFDDKYIIGKAIGLRYALDYLDGKFDDIASEIRGQHD